MGTGSVGARPRADERTTHRRLVRIGCTVVNARVVEVVVDVIRSEPSDRRGPVASDLTQLVPLVVGVGIGGMPVHPP